MSGVFSLKEVKDMDKNSQLNQLYITHWINLSSQLNLDENKDTFAMPFFIKLPEEINDPKAYKIMIFGQETWGWYDKCSLDNWIKIGMNEYEKFYLNRNGFKTSKNKKSSFWQKFRFFEKELSKLIKNQESVPVFIWNNISKIGNSMSKTGVSDNNRLIERTYFSVIAKEIEIIKPDLCIFMSGPNRDHDIKYHFPSIEFRKANDIDSIREMAVIEGLGVKGLRLYHPSYFGGFNNTYKLRALESLTSML